MSDFTSISEAVAEYGQRKKQQGYEQGVDDLLRAILSIDHYKYYTENRVLDKLYFEEDIKAVARDVKEKKND